MTLRELQAWVRRFDEERGWSEVDPAHIARQMGIGLGSSVREKSVREKMQANETRFPLEQARQAIERYRKKNAAAG